MAGEISRLEAVVHSLRDLDELLGQAEGLAQLFERKFEAQKLSKGGQVSMMLAALEAVIYVRRNDRCASYKGYLVRPMPFLPHTWQIFVPRRPTKPGEHSLIAQRESFEKALDWIDEHPVEDFGPGTRGEHGG